MHLSEFNTAHAAQIAGWVTSPQEALAWSSYTGPGLPPPSVFETWHNDPDIYPYVLFHDEVPIAYGEIWVDDTEQEIELARLIVDPAKRGQGVGRFLVEKLTERAASFGIEQVFMRVLPDNQAALSCYQHAGFLRVSAQDETVFNQHQPIDYVWLQRQLTNRPMDELPS